MEWAGGDLAAPANVRGGPAMPIKGVVEPRMFAATHTSTAVPRGRLTPSSHGTPLERRVWTRAVGGCPAARALTPPPTAPLSGRRAIRRETRRSGAAALLHPAFIDGTAQMD